MNQDGKSRLERRHEARMKVSAPLSRPIKQKKGSSRPNPIGFFKDVRSELTKVHWPSRDETKNYSLVVLVTLLLMIPYIALLDWAFQQASNFVLK